MGKDMGEILPLLSPGGFSGWWSHSTGTMGDCEILAGTGPAFGFQRAQPYPILPWEVVGENAKECQEASQIATRIGSEALYPTPLSRNGAHPGREKRAGREKAWSALV